MLLIYILLTIIAIGVLLISESGKKILGYLAILIVLCGLLYLLFGATLIIGWVASSKEIKDTLGVALGVIMVVGYSTYGIYYLYKNTSDGTFKRAIIADVGNSKQAWLGVYILLAVIIISFGYVILRSFI